MSDIDDQGRIRLVRALRARPSRAQSVVGLLLAALGFAVVTQVHSAQSTGLGELRQADLVRVLDGVSARSARLQSELKSLEQTRARLGSGSGQQQAALAESRARVRTLGILAGTLPATGPGIQLQISGLSSPVRSTVLLDALEELRDAGAEVIQIGPVRVVASTWLRDGDGGIVVDGTLVAPPYVVLAIGDPQTLATALGIPGGVLDVLTQQGAHAVLAQRSELTISALHPLSAPQYARPAPTSAGAP
ncbi:MAG: DUF881 domain-containing protein [Actinomycetes bacterium]